MVEAGTITGRTRVAAVIGNPVAHSFSPRLHNAAFAELGMDWVYAAFSVDPEDGEGAVEAMRTLNIAGMSVTMPHKHSVAAAADRRTSAVERLRSANTLFWHGGEIWADSTDGDGLVRSYEQSFGRALTGLRVGVLGAGGGAKSIIEACGRAECQELVVVNRSTERAAEAASLAPMARVGPVGDLGAVDVIINATSVGMAEGPAPELSPVPADLLNAEHDVVDIVYNPPTTQLLADAGAVGARSANGIGMLTHQAALQFERWTGETAPLTVMELAITEAKRPESGETS